MNERKFEDKPVLKQMLETGEISANKLARIASVATEENQEFWAAQAKLLPKAALETLVRDEEKFVPGHHADGKSLFSQELDLSAEVRKNCLICKIKA